MRTIKLGLALSLALPASGFAADYMRGPMYDPPSYQSHHNWSGTYIGGHGGFTQSILSSTGAFLADPLGINPNLTFDFPKGHVSSGSYGGFIGFNQQWEEVVLGFEFTYSRISGKGLTTTTQFDTVYDFGGGAAPAVALGTANARVTDLFGARGRAGWVAGWVMPYATVGLVVARGETQRFGLVTDGINVVSGSLSNGAATPFGFSAGIGVDVAITSNIFARAEIEYVGLRESKGVGGQFTTYRAGVAYKF